jgi:hypothetical protein
MNWSGSTRWYLHCPHQVESRWLGWLRCFVHFLQHTLQLWSRFVVVGDIVRRAPRSLRWAPIIWWGYRCTTPPCLLLWPSVITWRRRNPAKRWRNIGLCTTRLSGGGSLLYDSSSFIFPCQDKESLFQPIFPPLDEKPKPRIRKG